MEQHSGQKCRVRKSQGIGALCTCNLRGELTQAHHSSEWQFRDERQATQHGECRQVRAYSNAARQHAQDSAQNDHSGELRAQCGSQCQCSGAEAANDVW